jgi:hypothetical protein
VVQHAEALVWLPLVDQVTFVELHEAAQHCSCLPRLKGQGAPFLGTPCPQLKLIYAAEFDRTFRI